MPGITDQFASFTHFSMESQVYPTLAAGATVVSAAADWTYGAYAVIVPINTIAVRYHIISMTVESCNQNAVFQLALYKGAADDLIASTRFAVSGGFWGNSVYIMGSEPVEANAQLRARVASSDGLANQATLTVSIAYHVF